MKILFILNLIQYIYLWLSGTVGQYTLYCSERGCVCYLISLVRVDMVDQFKGKCLLRKMNFIEDFDDVRFSTDGERILSQISTIIGINIRRGYTLLTCSSNMSHYFQHVYTNWGRWSDPPCDGNHVKTRSMNRNCVPKCMVEDSSKLLSTQLTQYWETGDTPSTGLDDECIEAQTVTNFCCMLRSSPSPSMETVWDYSESSFSLTIQCSNIAQAAVRKSVTFSCKDSRALEWESLINDNYCSFDGCTVDKITQTLAAANVNFNSKTVYEDLVLITDAEKRPVLLIPCITSFSFVNLVVECVYDAETSLWRWSLPDLSTCTIGRTSSSSGRDTLATSRLPDNQCIVLPYSLHVKQNTDYCANLGLRFYKPKLPASADDAWIKWLSIYGTAYWVAHSNIRFQGNDKYIEWLDGESWEWSLTRTNAVKFLNQTEMCFTLNVLEPTIFKEVPCSSQLRDICIDTDVSNIKEGNWSEWLEWSECREYLRVRTRSCSIRNAYCTGCNGNPPEQKEFCCYDFYKIQDALVQVINKTKVNITCNEGFTIDGNVRKSQLYSCTKSPDWEQFYKPSCIPDPCPPPEDYDFITDYASSETVMENDDAKDITKEENSFQYRVGDSMIYECEKFSVIEGTNKTSVTSVCLPNKTWSLKRPVCVSIKLSTSTFMNDTKGIDWDSSRVILESDPLTRTLKDTKTLGESMESGETILLKCKPGYEFSYNQSEMEIKVHGSGMDDEYRCEMSMCAPPPAPLNNSYVISGQRAQKVGSSITYHCLPGFVDHLSRQVQLTSTCMENKMWDNTNLLQCERATCSSPPAVENGELQELGNDGVYLMNDFVMVTCNQGYGVMVGQKYQPSQTSSCRSSGAWDHEDPLFCRRIECGKIIDLEKAEVIDTNKNYYGGDTATIQCFPQHVFIGAGMERGQSAITRTCRQDGTWDGIEKIKCYTYQLQFGPTVTATEQPGLVLVTWLNTYIFRQEISPDSNIAVYEAQYTIYFHGKDETDKVRANFSRTITAPRNQRIHSINVTVPPGFYYEIWISGAISQWSEIAYGPPQATFYARTGIPAFANGFTRESMTPFLSNVSRVRNFDDGTSTVEVEFEDVFSPVNGSVHLFNIIVIEKNPFLTDEYLNGTIEENLTTWAAASDFPYWPPYLITVKCQLFTGAGCPDLASQLDFMRGRKKRMYTAKDPVFMGQDAFISSLTGASGLEDVAIDNNNIDDWIRPGFRQSNRKTQYTIGGQLNCNKNDKKMYCNGKLKLYNDYCIKLRAYTNEHFIDSPCAVLQEDASSLKVQWTRATLIPFGMAIVPFCFFIGLIVAIMMNTEDNDLEEHEIIKKRKEKQKEKFRKQWKNTIFKAYDEVLTTDNTEELNLLAIASSAAGKNFAQRRFTQSDRKKTKEKAKCSFFTNNKDWFERMYYEADLRSISISSLNDVKDDEPYRPENIIAEQHLPYEMFQEGTLLAKYLPKKY